MKIEFETLRNDPKLEIVLNKKDFEIINNQDKIQSGIYSYDLTETVRIEEKKINWIITILSYVVETILFSGGGDTYRSKTKLTFNYNKNKVEILLTDCDLEKAESIAQKLNLKLN